jgi:hypothetical protein
MITLNQTHFNRVVPLDLTPVVLAPKRLRAFSPRRHKEFLILNPNTASNSKTQDIHDHRHH